MNYRDKINQKGLKVNWLAKQIGVSQPALSNYMNGTRNMPSWVEVKLKQLLK